MSKPRKYYSAGTVQLTKENDDWVRSHTPWHKGDFSRIINEALDKARQQVPFVTSNAP